MRNDTICHASKRERESEEEDCVVCETFLVLQTCWGLKGAREEGKMKSLAVKQEIHLL